jgi:hypothetical protein
MADSSQLPEPRLILAVATLLVLIAAVLIMTLGQGDPAMQIAPTALSPDGAPTESQANAASEACRKIAVDAGCVLFVLQRTREPREMEPFAQIYARLPSR